MERATGTEVYGCGSPQTSDITLNIQTTTGGNFSISLNVKHTVEHLKKLVSKKLKVSKDRICLLHRERQLRDGTLEENGLLDGSRVILLPSVETGLLSQRPENSVMQALESLNDTQVNDFLSGKSPLNLTMRLGDHMMLIQLQLSTLGGTSLGSTSSTRSLRTSTPSRSSTTSLRNETRETHSPQTTPNQSINTDESLTNSDEKLEIPDESSLTKQDLEIVKSALDFYRERAVKKAVERYEARKRKENGTVTDVSEPVPTVQTPIKSLSNLVASSIDESTPEGKAALVALVKHNLLKLLAKTKKGIALHRANLARAMCDSEQPSTSASLTPDSSLSDDSDNYVDQSSFLAESTIDEYPMENLFNSAVDKGLFNDHDESMMDREISNLATTSNGSQETPPGTLPPFQSLNEPLKNKRFQYLLHKTSKFKHPIAQSKQKAFMQSVVNKHKKRMQIRQDSSLAQPSTSRTEPYITNNRKLILQPSSSGSVIDNATPSTSKQVSFIAPDAPKKPQRVSSTPRVDSTTKALIEASKNLTQKLKKLSKEVLTNKIDLRTAEESVRLKIGPGAVIESMKHHGKGIYSGTFSGTLNPALQDRYGRPKRDISTIIHILNDLLCAAPSITIAQKETKDSFANTITSESKCLGCSQPSCSYGKCDGHAPSTSKSCAHDTKTCKCRLSPGLCPSCAAKSPAGEICKKCNTAQDNSKTKCKLEQLRLVMQQKKERREARKLKPYSQPTNTMTSPEPNTPLQEEIDTVA